MSSCAYEKGASPLLKLTSAALMVGVASGCSSDLSRFSYQDAVQNAHLTTASVQQQSRFPGLAPLGSKPKQQIFRQNAYPAQNASAAALPNYQQTAQYQPNYYPVSQPQAQYNQAQYNAAPNYQPAVDYNQPFPGSIKTASVPHYPTRAPLQTSSTVQRSQLNPAPVMASQSPIVAPVRASVPVRTAPASSAPVQALTPARTTQSSASRRQPTRLPKPHVASPTYSPVYQPQTVASIVPARRSIPKPTIRRASYNVNNQPANFAPAQQPFPQRQVAGHNARQAQPILTGSVNKSQSGSMIVPMAPDPIVTGSIPSQKLSKGGWSVVGGTRLTLAKGETIYNLSRRYGVPAAEILRANNLRDTRDIKAGQQLTIPVYVYSANAPVSAPDNNPLTVAAKSRIGSNPLPRSKNIPIPHPRHDLTVLPQGSNSTQLSAVKTKPVAITSAARSSANPGQYIVVSGDSLSKIAKAHSVSVAALKAQNGLSGSNIRIGQALKIPVGGVSQMTPDPVTTASVRKPQVTTAAPTSVQQTAAASKNVIAPEQTGISKFRWPARGQISSSFGGKSDDGTRNEGIDVLMPEGTPIKAAENGVVIYASNGLKGYGNTVLLRHDNNIVTVYAHAKTLNVKRGEKVQRGQVIAKSGMTGTAKRPKLHFEIREDSTPVNPIKYLGS